MPRTMLEFVIKETDRVHALALLLQEGGPILDEAISSEAGALLAASQYHFSRISGMVSDDAGWLAAAAAGMGTSAGIYGARVMPWGAAGSVVMLVRMGATDHVQNLVSRLKSQFGRSPLLLAGTSGGAKTTGVVSAHFTS